MDGPPRMVGFSVFPGAGLGMEDEARRAERGVKPGYISPRPHYSLGQQMMRSPVRKQSGKAQVRFN